MYDVFVSYATRDHEWAARVQRSLSQKGLNVFFDRLRLEAGKPWVPELRHALSSSKNLVALWSDEANQSPWVQRELATFDALASDDPSRRLIVLNLQGSNRAYATVQAITELGDANVYAAGAAAVSSDLWNAMMDRIERAVDADAQAVPIPVAVLTLTQADLGRFEPALGEQTANRLNITRDELLSRYGATRRDWKPLGSTRTIGQILDDMREHLNQQIDGRRFRWDFEPDGFWDQEVTDVTRQFARQFPSAKLSVVIIDAVALQDRQVYGRLMLFQGCWSSQRTAIIVLPPFAGDPRLANLREWLKDRGAPYFDPYFEPLQRPGVRVLAQCGFGITDEDDIRRLLLVSMGQFLSEPAPRDRSPYLTVGST